MKYTVYKITNNINGKIYKGAHKTSDLNDGYMGSGKILLRAIEKYGVENFTKEILHIFDNSEEMYNKERELVNEQFIKRSDVYNLKLGGSGGFDHVNNDVEFRVAKNRRARKIANENGALEEAQKALTVLRKDPEWSYNRGRSISKSLILYYKNNPGPMLGKTHSEATKNKIGEANSIHQAGSGNSQYGTRWIHNSELRESQKISNDCEIPDGWSAGRVINWGFLDRLCIKCNSHLNLKSPSTIKQCNTCRSQANKTISNETYMIYWNEFLMGNYSSIHSFSKTTTVSGESIVNNWYSNIKEYRNIRDSMPGKRLSSTIVRDIINNSGTVV